MFELFSLILNFLLSSGLMATLIFYKSKRRQSSAEASLSEVTVRREEILLEHQSIEFLKTQLSDAYSEIDKMQDIINKNRDQIIALMRLSKELEINLLEYQTTQQRISLTSCSIIDCTKRKKI